MRRNIVSIIFTIILSLIFTNNLLAENRLALLIGNSKYIHGGSLNNSVTDVRAMKNALESLGFTVMKYENCTQKTMKRAMDNFGIKLKGQDVGLFFYSGHGVQVNGHNYLIPTNAKLHNENDTEYDCVRADRVLAKMENAGTKTSIVILDACRDNPFERSWRKGTKGTGLAFMNAPSGSLIAYSTAPGKTALDGRGKNSPYTFALLQHIRTPNITVLEMFQGVRSTVMVRTGGKQTPWESTSLRGNFYFNDKREMAVVKDPEQKSSPPETTAKPDAVALYDQVKKTLWNPKDKKWTNPKKAIELLNKAIELDPDYTEAYWIRGHIYYDLKRRDRAIQDHDKAIELNPQYGYSYLNRGKDYFFRKQYLKAIQSYNKLIELHPNFILSYINRGDAYVALEQYIKAIESYNKAIELDPKDSHIYECRGGAYSNLKQYIKAIQDYNKAIELDPKSAGTYLDRGKAYYDLNQPIKAIQDYDKAIELAPNYAFAYSYRGNAYHGLKQYIKAIQDYDKAIELTPKYSWLYNFRGNAYYNLNQPIKAIQDYDKAIELDPNDGDAYNNRGLEYLELQRVSQGCADLNKACDLGYCGGLKRALKAGHCR